MASVIYSGQHTKTSRFINEPTIRIDERSDNDALQGEAQHIFRHRLFNVVTGATFNSVSSQQDLDRTITAIIGGRPFQIRRITQQHTQAEQRTGYIYIDTSLLKDMLWIVGMSYDDFHSQKTRVTEVNPKLGMQWRIAEGMHLRVAGYQTRKPPLATSQTLQPTEIAGFNQFFDDVNGAKSTTYAIGLDTHLSANVYAGVEIFGREIDFPINLTGQSIDQDEVSYGGYVYWTPYQRWAVGAELLFDRYRNDETVFFIPKRLDTFSAPISVRYFDPSGFFAGLRGTYVFQEITPAAGQLDVPEGSDHFFLVDAEIGFRLPGRYGIISLIVRNILNEKFKYKDDTFREGGSQNPHISPYIPEQTVFAQLTLNF